MKRKLVLVMACCMVLGLAGCSSESGSENTLQVEAIPAAETTDNAEKEGPITEDQACEAVKKYCIDNFPDLADMVDSDEYTLYWEASTTDDGEICVLYRAYTGALIRYYVNPETGDTYVTEQVPGIIDEEQKTDETLNIKDYIE